jgi:TatD DNase family protein
MKFEYFDIHSHIYFPDYDKDREEEIARMKKEKIGTITIATDLASSKEAIRLAEKHENLYACIGQHPGDLTRDSVFDEKLIKLAEHKKVVAIGECGLDYFRLPKDAKENDSEVAQRKLIQKTVFEYHIDLALANDLPLMLHIRSSKGTNDAYLDALEILEKHYKISETKLRGNAHFFAGDTDILRRLLAIGFTVSFTGVITFTEDYDELIKYAPLDMILSETDSPFVSPVPHRGERNSPLYVPEVVKKIAEVKNEPLESVKTALVANALRQFPGIAS